MSGPDQPRRILAVTTSRADFSHLYWPLKALEAEPELEVSVVASGAHLDPSFGETVHEVEAAGFELAARVPCLDPGDDDLAMARTLGRAGAGFAEVLGELRPDLLLLIADRYEMLAPASAALALRIPIAHIEGGDISEGAVDDAVRNALTKMSHLHFTPTEDARRRVLAMGEEAWRVVRSGAPSLDHLRRSELPDRGALADALDRAPAEGYVVVAYHPVTLLRDTLEEVDALYQALEPVDRDLVFCFPNADAGGRALVERARAFCADRPGASVHVNLDPLSYWALLRDAGAFVGNSSSGIMETASLELPTVDVGIRQRGRTRARNVIHADADGRVIGEAITQALDPGFRDSLAGMANPYGDGRAAEVIAETLRELPLDGRLLMKRALPLDEGVDPPRFRQPDTHEAD